jgi:hypothetical protein
MSKRSLGRNIDMQQRVRNRQEMVNERLKNWKLSLGIQPIVFSGAY